MKILLILLVIINAGAPLYGLFVIVKGLLIFFSRSSSRGLALARMNLYNWRIIRFMCGIFALDLWFYLFNHNHIVAYFVEHGNLIK